MLLIYNNGFLYKIPYIYIMNIFSIIFLSPPPSLFFTPVLLISSYQCLVSISFSKNLNEFSQCFFYRSICECLCLKECGHLTSGYTTEEYVFSFPSNNYLNVTSLSMMSFFCILLHFAFFEQFDQHCVLCFQQRSELYLRCFLPCVLTSFLHLWSHFLSLPEAALLFQQDIYAIFIILCGD